MREIFLSKEFFFFLAFGGTAAVVNLVCGQALYHLARLPYTAAVFIGAASGLLVNFLLNYAFNFHYRERGMLGQFRTFFVVAAIGTVLTAVLARLLLFLLHLCGITSLTLLDHAFSAELMAHVLSVGLVTIYSFLGHKYLSFNAGIRAQMRRLLKHHRDRA